MNKNAKVGEIWIATIPIINHDEENNLIIKLQNRPCLIVDDGRGLIVEQDLKNYHILKIITQNDSYKRKLITNWKSIGLKKKSYIRIELPIKLEKEQLHFKVTEISKKDLNDIYYDIYKLLNIKSLQKIAKFKEEKL